MLHRFHNVGILIIQIRLTDCKRVKIILAAHLIPFPGAASESGLPVVGLFVKPKIEIAVGIVFSLPGFLEPEVFCGSVVRHKIHNQFHAAPVYLPDQLLHVLHSTEFGHDALVIRDVITVIIVRALITRTEPQGIYPELLQIVELGYDSFQIPDTVPV